MFVMFSINTAVSRCCLSERTKILMSQFYATRRVYAITSEQEKCFVWNPQCTTVRQLLLPLPMPNYTLCTWLTYSRYLGPSVFTFVSFASGPTTLAVRSAHSPLIFLASHLVQVAVGVARVCCWGQEEVSMVCNRMWLQEKGCTTMAHCRSNISTV